MPNFSFLNFQYGRSVKSPKKKRSQLNTNNSITERQSSINNSNLKPDNKKSELPSVEELRWAFDKFDTNKDGRISRQEYKSALRALDREIVDSEIAKAFQALDSDGDGFIDFKEFIEMFNKGSDSTKVADIESAFRIFDVDGDGRISAEELSQVLKKLGEGCSMKACRGMVKGVDADGDGYINLEEFVRMMSTTKKPITNN